MTKSNLFLSRLLSESPAIVVAIDHGMFDGPMPGIDQVGKIPEIILPETDAVLSSVGLLRDIGPQLYGRRGDPMPIVRLNWSSMFCFTWGYHAGESAAVCRPAEALRAGAQCVLICLTLQTGSEQRDVNNVKLWAELAAEAHALGLPVIGEYFPVDDEGMSAEQMALDVKIGCRVLYELGADVIKTFYTDNFAEIVAGCPTPILALGGKRLPTDLEALSFAQKQVADGAAGIVFGRNVFQSAKPIELQRALIDVLKRDVKPADAVAQYGLSR